MNIRRILLVEDDPQDEALILRALRKVNLGNRVDVVRDGQEALDYVFCGGAHADRTFEFPAIVILDLHLPKIGGLEVLARLRKDPRTRLLPVTILTSSDDEHDRLQSYANGANGFVRKPIDFAEFARAVAHLGLYWVATNEPPPN